MVVVVVVPTLRKSRMISAYVVLCRLKVANFFFPNDRFRNFPKKDTLSSEFNFSFESAPPIVGQCYACCCTNRANFGLNG